MPIQVENPYDKKEDPTHYAIAKRFLTGKDTTADDLRTAIGSDALSNRMVGIVIERLGEVGVRVERERDRETGMHYTATGGHKPVKGINRTTGPRVAKKATKGPAKKVAHKPVKKAPAKTGAAKKVAAAKKAHGAELSAIKATLAARIAKKKGGVRRK